MLLTDLRQAIFHLIQFRSAAIAGGHNVCVLRADAVLDGHQAGMLAVVLRLDP